MGNGKPKQKQKQPTGKSGKLKFGSPEWRAKFMKKGKKGAKGTKAKQAGKPAGKPSRASKQKRRKN